MINYTATTYSNHYAKVFDNLDKCVNLLKMLGYQVALCGLYGSQNYGLDMPYSDTDFKAVVIPTLDQIILNKAPVSKTIIPEGDYAFDGEIDVKDIRLMVTQWKKGASNFLELLFTDFIYINPDFPILTRFLTHNEKIAHCNEISVLNAMLGMIRSKKAQLTKDIPSQAEEIKQHGYSAKALSHILRLDDMIQYYFKVPYSELLNPFIAKDLQVTDIENTIRDRKERYNYLREVRSYNADINTEKAIALAAIVEDHATKLIMNYPDIRTVVHNLATEEHMDKIAYQVIKESIAKELMKEQKESRGL